MIFNCATSLPNIHPCPLGGYVKQQLCNYPSSITAATKFNSKYYHIDKLNICYCVQ